MSLLELYENGQIDLYELVHACWFYVDNLRESIHLALSTKWLVPSRFAYEWSYSTSTPTCLSSVPSSSSHDQKSSRKSSNTKLIVAQVTSYDVEVVLDNSIVPVRNVDEKEEDVCLSLKSLESEESEELEESEEALFTQSVKSLYETCVELMHQIHTHNLSVHKGYQHLDQTPLFENHLKEVDKQLQRDIDNNSSSSPSPVLPVDVSAFSSLSLSSHSHSHSPSPSPSPWPWPSPSPSPLHVLSPSPSSPRAKSHKKVARAKTPRTTPRAKSRAESPRAKSQSPRAKSPRATPPLPIFVGILTGTPVSTFDHRQLEEENSSMKEGIL
jgi:hypothetical protein